jgi:hypothetical protein
LQPHPYIPASARLDVAAGAARTSSRTATAATVGDPVIWLVGLVAAAIAVLHYGVHFQGGARVGKVHAEGSAGAGD